MTDPYSELFKEAIASAPAGAVMVNTLEMRHESIGGVLFLAQSLTNFEATLETGATVVFEAVPFRITLPRKSAEGLQELQISIDNVDRRISDFCQNAAGFMSPVELLYRPYLMSDLSEPQMVPPLRLFLRNVSVSATEVAGRATYADLINKKFPSDPYTRKRFPGLGDQ